MDRRSGCAEHLRNDLGCPDRCHGSRLQSIQTECELGRASGRPQSGRTFVRRRVQIAVEEVIGRGSSLQAGRLRLNIRQRRPGAPVPVKAGGCGICDTWSRSDTYEPPTSCLLWCLEVCACSNPSNRPSQRSAALVWVCASCLRHYQDPTNCLGGCSSVLHYSCGQLSSLSQKTTIAATFR